MDGGEEWEMREGHTKRKREEDFRDKKRGKENTVCRELAEN